MAIVQNKTTPPSAAYVDNFDSIFGTDEERKARHAKEKAEKAELNEVMQQAVKTAYIGGSFEPFKSPVDGTVIRNPRDLKSHNSRHGVTDIREYGDEWFQRRGQEMHSEKIGSTAQAKRERQKICHDVLKAYKMIR